MSWSPRFILDESSFFERFYLPADTFIFSINPRILPPDKVVSLLLNGPNKL